MDIMPGTVTPGAARTHGARAQRPGVVVGTRTEQLTGSLSACLQWVMGALEMVSLFAEFARTATPRAPLYHRLALGIAADPALAGLLLIAPPMQRQPVLLFACVHDLLLAGRPDVGLARFYPDLVAEPDRGDPMPAFRAFTAAHADELAELLVTRSTQTNEIGRCALLLPAFGIVGDEVGPLAHLDVGASAGLNLLLDRCQYTYDPGGELGEPSSVALTCVTRGDVRLPAAMPMIVERVGLDRSPVDVGDDDAARWLTACVWPDQTDRMERLQAAIAIARSTGVEVRAGDAVTDTAALVVGAAAHPVVTTTWVLNYLSVAERRAFVEALDACGRRRDLSWVFAESPVLAPDLPTVDATTSTTALVLVRWRRGRRTARHLADCHPHGYWLRWC
jgi:hypothetical protein